MPEHPSRIPAPSSLVDALPISLSLRHPHLTPPCSKKASATAQLSIFHLQRRIALLFLRVLYPHSFLPELAATTLGATTTLVSDKSSSIEKGVSLKDTGPDFARPRAECIVPPPSRLRSPFASSSPAPPACSVLNAGDGMA